LSDVVAGCVEDPEDDNGVAFNTVKELVRKPLGQDSSEPTVVEGKALRRLFQATERSRYRKEKLAAQARALAFVPFLRLTKVRLGGCADGDAPSHWVREL
jgi:hypothetical protein